LHFNGVWVVLETLKTGLSNAKCGRAHHRNKVVIAIVNATIQRDRMIRIRQ
jgi:hypothetical protein